MTKKEQHQAINKTFYEHVNKHFTDYYIDNQETGGRIYLVSPDGSMDNSIEYHMSQHTISTYPWCSEQTKMDVECLEEFLKEEIKKYEMD